MDTEKKFGLKKPLAILLFIQMFLVVFMLIIAVYLLAFVAAYNFGGWMITSYVLITLSVLSATAYATFGYKRSDWFYRLSVIPFLGAVFVNILLPGREPFQMAVLSVLFALTFAFMLRQKDERFTSIVALLMVGVSLLFSVYSSIKADVSFLGNLGKGWPTYVAMYASIFIPTIMSGTYALTYKVRSERKKNSPVEGESQQAE